MQPDDRHVPGRLAEEGPTTAILNSPSHVHTQILMSSIPRIDGAATRPDRLRARPASGQPLPGTGCLFAHRCPRALHECAADPPVVEVTPDHRAACVLAGRASGPQ